MVFLLLTFWLAPPSATSPATPSSIHEAELDRIVDRHIEAIGGATALARLRSWRASGQLYSAHDRAATPFVFSVERPRRSQVVLGLVDGAGDGSETLIMTTNGNRGWWRNGDPAVEPESMPQRQVERERRLLEFDVLRMAREEGRVMNFLGQSRIDGHPVYVVKVTFGNGDGGLYYVDRKSYLVRRMLEAWSIDGETMEIVRDFDRYRKVGGMKLPHRVVETNAQGWRRFEIENIELNPELEAELFRVPVTLATAGR